MKKVVVKENIRSSAENTDKAIFYVNAYSGIFKLSGDVEDLNYIYQGGIGYRRSQGFGMIDIV
jgi:CRISPR-associated endoribonuclease Cas6